MLPPAGNHADLVGLKRPGYQKEHQYIKKKINLHQKQNISHKELRLPLQAALTTLRDVNLNVQISWRAQHFEHLQ